MKVIDMHCDTISELYLKRQMREEATLRKSALHIDLEKLAAGEYGLQNFALFVHLHQNGDPYVYAKQLLKFFHQEMEEFKDFISVVKTWDEIETNWKEGKLSALLTLEEGGICQGDLNKLYEFYDSGVRMMTLTWNYENELAYPNHVQIIEKNGNKSAVWSVDTERGLKEMGITFVEEMERLGMIIDISHLNDAGIRDVFCYTKKPFVASHSNARGIAKHPRNLSDEMLRTLSERGGVAGINFCAAFLRDEENGVEPIHSFVSDMVRHIEHMKQVGGIECIGLGSDFDGFPSILELKDAAGIQRLADEMHRRKFTDSEIEAVFAGNVLRVYKEIL